jgi:hypothetical protein
MRWRTLPPARSHTFEGFLRLFAFTSHSGGVSSLLSSPLNKSKRPFPR